MDEVTKPHFTCISEGWNKKQLRKWNIIKNAKTEWYRRWNKASRSAEILNTERVLNITLHIHSARLIYVDIKITFLFGRVFITETTFSIYHTNTRKFALCTYKTILPRSLNIIVNYWYRCVFSTQTKRTCRRCRNRNVFIWV